MSIRSFIKKHIISFAIIIFICVYLIIHQLKPAFIYNKDGTLRQFGIGYRHKTILPMWLIVIILSILSYLLVLYYLAYPKIKY